MVKKCKFIVPKLQEVQKTVNALACCKLHKTSQQNEKISLLAIVQYNISKIEEIARDVSVSLFLLFSYYYYSSFELTFQHFKSEILTK